MHPTCKHNPHGLRPDQHELPLKHPTLRHSWTNALLGTVSGTPTVWSKMQHRNRVAQIRRVYLRIYLGGLVNIFPNSDLQLSRTRDEIPSLLLAQQRPHQHCQAPIFHINLSTNRNHASLEREYSNSPSLMYDHRFLDPRTLFGACRTSSSKFSTSTTTTN